MFPPPHRTVVRAGGGPARCGGRALLSVWRKVVDSHLLPQGIFRRHEGLGVDPGTPVVQLARLQATPERVREVRYGEQPLLSHAAHPATTPATATATTTTTATAATAATAAATVTTIATDPTVGTSFHYHQSHH